jgi:hypothetical protein
MVDLISPFVFGMLGKKPVKDQKRSETLKGIQQPRHAQTEYHPIGSLI